MLLNIVAEKNLSHLPNQPPILHPTRNTAVVNRMKLLNYLFVYPNRALKCFVVYEQGMYNGIFEECDLGLSLFRALHQLACTSLNLELQGFGQILSRMTLCYCTCVACPGLNHHNVSGKLSPRLCWARREVPSPFSDQNGVRGEDDKA
jgi:hypothetical protein